MSSKDILFCSISQKSTVWGWAEGVFRIPLWRTDALTNLAYGQYPLLKEAFICKDSTSKIRIQQHEEQTRKQPLRIHGFIFSGSHKQGCKSLYQQQWTPAVESEESLYVTFLPGVTLSLRQTDSLTQATFLNLQRKGLVFSFLHAPVGQISFSFSYWSHWFCKHCRSRFQCLDSLGLSTGFKMSYLLFLLGSCISVSSLHFIALFDVP